MEFKRTPHPNPPPDRGGSLRVVWVASVIVFLLGTFVLTRFLNFFISPDETANAFFAHAFASSGSLRVFDVMSSYVGDVLHPRSMVMDWNYLLPGSFLGLIVIYGILTAILGSWSLTFLTPVIVILAALAWNQILQHWFSKRIAFVSSILFLFHPAIWYYSARSLMPNVLFVCCVIFSVYFLLLITKKQKASLSFTSQLHNSITFSLPGFFLALALFVRLAEIYWLIPLFIFLLIINRKSLSLQKCALMLVGFLIPIGILLFLNFKTYGHPFTTGYTFLSEAQRATATSIAPPSPLSEDRLSWLLPFGFHPRAVFWHSWDYLLMLFWWLTLPALCAIPVFLKDRKQKIFLFVSIIIAFWLCIWYGSWRLNDNPDPTLVTIANSYVRYWLPMFILSTPFVATTVVWIVDRFSKTKEKIGKKMLVSMMLLLIVLNIRIVFFEGADALQHVSATLEQSIQIRNRVLAIVPEDGVIITDRSDKIFFPARHVMVPLRSDRTFSVMPQFVDRSSLYYYGITLPASDLNFLNQQKLDPIGLRIHVIETFSAESLYQINKKQQSSKAAE